MAEFIFNAEVRTKTGKGDSRRLRAAGKVPAVIYGKELTPVHVSLPLIETTKILRKANRNAIFEIQLSNAEKRNVILRDFQKHPIKLYYSHLDFQAIEMDKPIQVDVEVVYVGTPIGKKFGGVFTSLSKKVRIESLPEKIPQVINLDITNLEAGASYHVSDIPAGDFKVITSSKIALCQVSKAKEEETAEGEAEAAPAAPAKK
jgi:large subunit ribosomal protein L25